MRIFAAFAALALSAAAAPAFAQETDKDKLALAAAPAVPATSALPTTPAVDPGSLAIAHDILANAFPPDKREQMMSSILDSLVAQTRQAMAQKPFSSDKEFQRLLDNSTRRMFDAMKAVITPQLPDVFESMTHAYARMFSRDELTQILAFVKTPAGQHYFQQASMIMKDPDVQAANQRLAAKLMDKLPELQRQTMQDVENYVAEHEKQPSPSKRGNRT